VSVLVDFLSYLQGIIYSGVKKCLLVENSPDWKRHPHRPCFVWGEREGERWVQSSFLSFLDFYAQK
jgi:hypothetical protein